MNDAARLSFKGRATSSMAETNYKDKPKNARKTWLQLSWPEPVFLVLAHGPSANYLAHVPPKAYRRRSTEACLQGFFKRDF
jgi:hypothetical protein